VAGYSRPMRYRVSVCRVSVRRVARRARARAGLAARLIALLVGLDAGLGWVPAAGVSPRLAAAVAGVALLVVLSGGRHGPGGNDRLDLASGLALAVTVLAAAGATVAPAGLVAGTAGSVWLAFALLAGVGMVTLLAAERPGADPAPPGPVHPDLADRPARRPVSLVRLTGNSAARAPVGDDDGKAQSSVSSYR